MLRLSIAATLLLLLAVACSGGSEPEIRVQYQPHPTLTSLCKEAASTANLVMQYIKGGQKMAGELAALQGILDSCMRNDYR